MQHLGTDASLQSAEKLSIAPCQEEVNYEQQWSRECIRSSCASASPHYRRRRTLVGVRSDRPRTTAQNRWGPRRRGIFALWVTGGEGTRYVRSGATRSPHRTAGILGVACQEYPRPGNGHDAAAPV